jgi:hypothetical protein
MIDVIKYCEAAERIKEDFGLEDSLRYLIGEKFYYCLKQLRYSISFVHDIEELKKKNALPKTKRDLEKELAEEKKRIPELLQDRDLFVSKIKEIYEPCEIEDFLEGIPAFGAAEQFLSEETYTEWRNKGVLERDVVDEAEDSLILAEMREFLL